LRESVAGLRALWNARLDDRVPLQYLTSTSHWRDLVLVVTPATLIPRPETERMVDFVADALRRSPELARAPWADLGTGSGALAIAVARELREVARRDENVFGEDSNDAPVVHAVDVDPAAIAVATENARRHGCFRDGSTIAFHVGSWFEPLDSVGVDRFGGIVSNPPYIPSADVPHLQPEVVLHEPNLALDGGDGAGTRCVDAVVAGAAARLKPGGFLLLETNGGTQAEAIARSLRDFCVGANAEGSFGGSFGGSGGVSRAPNATDGSSMDAEKEKVFEDVAVLRDFCGVGRFVSARRKQ
jgi:release factor glutamine methyltransferase